MKYSIPTALLALAIAPSAVQAQVPVQVVTVQLTETYTDPALVERDAQGRPTGNPYRVYSNDFTTLTNTGITETHEYGANMMRWRISNREILEVLVDQGVIPEIFGWSLVYVNDEIMMATKNGQFIPVDAHIKLEYLDYWQEQSRYRETTTTTNAGTTSRASGTDLYKDLCYFDMNFSVWDIEILTQGLIVENYRILSPSAFPDQPGAKECSHLTGSLYDAYYDEHTLIDGSVRMTPARFLFVDPG